MPPGFVLQNGSKTLLRSSAAIPAPSHDAEPNLGARRLGADHELPLVLLGVAHRVRGVHDQVQEHLLQLHAPALDGGQRGSSSVTR